MLDHDTCPTCGKLPSQWKANEGRGWTDIAGAAHCCQGCAEHTGCTCDTVAVPENIDDWN